MGIPLGAGLADPGVQQLAQRARSGDKQAQLDLGIAYEEGRGVARDLLRAERMYMLAAADIEGRKWIYLPPVTRVGSGRTIPIEQGARQPGLADAARRLEALRIERGRR